MKQSVAPVKTTPTDTFSTVQKAVMITSGWSAEEITLDTVLEDDLGISPSELEAVVTQILAESGVTPTPRLAKSLLESATVAEMVELIDEEKI